MELPILLAVDTTENWNLSSTVLGNSELAIELEIQPDQTAVKRLLVGDGYPVGPNVARLRATPEIIKGLPETLQALAQSISDETARATEAEQQLQQNIDNKETAHDDTLTGAGTESDPLSVRPGSFNGITAAVALTPDGTTGVFDLPDDFIFARLSLVEINGLIQRPGVDYTLNADDRTLTMAEAVEAGDSITVWYTAAQPGDQP
jgi:hypothetical protein